jgi:hypothetical protein
MAMVMENQQQPAVVVAPQMQLIPRPPPPPPLPPPPAPAYKHHCRVCKKGFMCGRALGGHMRAHGIADDGISAEDDDGTLELDDEDDDGVSAPCGEPSEDHQAGSPSTTAKRMYGLRANPGRLRSCRVCENCGKEFTSWKSLLDHGRCGFDDDDQDLDDGGGSLRSSSPPRDPAEDGAEEDDEDLALASGWSKGKRSRRAKVAAGTLSELQQSAPSSEEEDLANCLVMLSSSRVAQPAAAVVDADQESCASASKDEDRNRLLLPQPISIVAPLAAQMRFPAPQVVVAQHVPAVPRGLFECKACKKVFTSHQALGGHRASHKKVKGCFAAKLESSSRTEPQSTATPPPYPPDNSKLSLTAILGETSTTEPKNPYLDDSHINHTGKIVNVGTSEVAAATPAPEMPVADAAPGPSAFSPFKKKGKVHECSICHRVFTSGQALGGHKRCHWLTSSSADPAKLQPVVPDHLMAAMCHHLTLGRPVFDAATDQRILDLNVPTNPSAEAIATRQAAELNEIPLCLNAPASMYVHSWTGHSNASHVNKTRTSSRNDAAAGGGGGAATEDEADSTSAKKAKISDLKDMKVAGESLPWLQVGIGISSSENNEKSTQE